MKSTEIILRPKETEKLMKAYQPVKEEQPGICFSLLCGEEGTGKQLLISSFLNQIIAEDGQALIVTGHCSMQNNFREPYQPFKEILRNMFTIIGKSKKNKSSKWKDTFIHSAGIILKIAPELIHTFIPIGDLVTSLGKKMLAESGCMEKLSRATTQSRVVPDNIILAEQYIEVIRNLAERYHLVLFIRDMQWMDNSSTDLLYQLSTRLDSLPMLFIGSYRSTEIQYRNGDERDPLEALITHLKIKAGDVFIDLDSLTVEARKDFMLKIINRDRNDYKQEFIDQIFNWTNGNPLFVDEYIRFLKEQKKIILLPSGKWSFDDKSNVCSKMPLRIEGILQERIAKLDAFQTELLSFASVLGEIFPLWLLSACTQQEQDILLPLLTGELCKQRRLLTEIENYPGKNEKTFYFRFSYTFLQIYLYGNLGKSQRLLMHRKAAAILAENHICPTDTPKEYLTYHYIHSMQYAEAVKVLLSESEKLMDMEHYTEAFSLLGQSLEIAEKACEDNFETEKYLRLLTLYLQLHRIVSTHSCDNSRNCLQRGTQLILQPGTNSDIHSTFLFEAWMYHLSEANFTEAATTAAKQPVKLLRKMCRSITFFWEGNFTMAARTLPCTIEGTDEQQMLLLAYRPLILFMDGQYEQVEKLLSNKQNTSTGGSFHCRFMKLQGDILLSVMDRNTFLMQKQAELLLEMTGAYPFPSLQGLSALCRGITECNRDIWAGIHTIRKTQKQLGKLYGCICDLLVCRQLLSRQLNDEFERNWQEAVNNARKTGIGMCLEELYFMKLNSWE